MTDPKDPQLYARVRQESEKKRKIAEAERAVLDAGRTWFWDSDPVTEKALDDAIGAWLDLLVAKL